ncbi:MAG: thermostable hemolysin [Pseudomonadota bacterium]
MSATPLCVNAFANPQPTLCVHATDSSQREQLESYIHSRYAETYNANIEHFLPYLLATWGDDTVQGVLGLRPGACGRFFVENYLDAPIERIVSELQGSSVERSLIIETGNLAGSRGSSQLLFIALTEVLYQAGFRWVTFTATAQVSALLHRLGFAPQEICEADLQRLGTHGKDWGSYYDNKPCVVIGDVEQAWHTLRRNEFAQKVLQEHAAEVSQIVMRLRAHSEACQYE